MVLGVCLAMPPAEGAKMIELATNLDKEVENERRRSTPQCTFDPINCYTLNGGNCAGDMGVDF